MKLFLVPFVCRHDQVAALLLTASSTAADVSVRDRHGRTAMDVALKNGHRACVLLLQVTLDTDLETQGCQMPGL